MHGSDEDNEPTAGDARAAGVGPWPAVVVDLEGLPVPVHAEDVPEVMTAYGNARTACREVRETLTAAGFELADFPHLCPGVDLNGHGAVVVGAISPRTARRLAQAPHNGSHAA